MSLANVREARSCLNFAAFANVARGPATITRTASNRGFAALVGADAHDFVERHHEYFSVADLSGFRGFHDRVDGFAGHLVGDGHLELNLRQEVDGVLAAAINFRMAFLTPKA